MAEPQSARGFLGWLRDHYLGWQIGVACFWGLFAVWYAFLVIANPSDRGHIFMLVLAIVVCGLTAVGVLLERRRRRQQSGVDKPDDAAS
ncbi:hypothetical protein [Leifsonia shinshuensis]|uniref:hypothetical protein n=1 Tax=Leifsonia shinshuensis TaxID=150026 RepID=UPI002860DD24|nr:hypothetical protein [Leifsonia shinshuensis]MDR6969759.1 hypothetical protein [Leifsonia shinshuensis]